MRYIVQAQLWIAVIVHLLIWKLKQEFVLPQDPNEIFHILCVTILEKTPINELFATNKERNLERMIRNQLSLFELYPVSSESA